MSPTALGLVLTAAVIHASWNLFAKRGGRGGPGFVWLYTCAEVAFYAPVAAVTFSLTSPTVGPVEIGLIVVSAVLHTGYFLLLQRGYGMGDLSVVYPIARGLAPLLAVVAAVTFLGERPSLTALLGSFAVGAGVLWIGFTNQTTGAGPWRASESAFLSAVATATVIAAYSVWDGYAMQHLALSPILFQWGGNFARLLFLSPLVLRSKDVRQIWTEKRVEVIAVGSLAPLAYILVLWAFTMAPVSYVAPARELSIVVATAFGVMLLGERATGQRFAAAAVIAVGVILLGTS